MALGREMCVLMPLCLVCFLMVLMTAEQMTENTMYAINPTCALVFLVVLQIVAIVYMERSCRRSSRVPETDPKEVMTLARRRVGKLEKLVKTFAGLWIFGGGGIVLDVIIFLYVLLSLIDAGTANWICMMHLVLLTVFHFVKICFTIGQIHYLQFSFQNSIQPSRKAIYLIMGVNVLVWLSCFQQHSESLTEYYKKIDAHDEEPDKHDTNYTYDCLPTVNSTWYNAVHDWGKYLYPCTMEFSFVAIDLLYNVLVTCKERTVELVMVTNRRDSDVSFSRSSDEQTNRHRHRQSPPTYDSITNREEGSDEINETTPLHGNTRTLSQGSYGEVILESQPTWMQKVSMYFKIFSPQAFKVSIAFLIIFTGLEFLVVYARDLNDAWLTHVQYILDCLFSLHVIRLCYLGISCCRDNNGDFKGEDVLRFITTAGVWAISMFGIVAGFCIIVNPGHQPPNVSAFYPYIIVFVDALTIAHTFFQTWFYVKAAPDNFRDDLDEDEKASLSNCLKFLSFYNIVKWVLDTFCEFYTSEKLVPIRITVFRDQLLYVNLFILPAAILYRFQIAASFFKLIF